MSVSCVLLLFALVFIFLSSPFCFLDFVYLRLCACGEIFLRSIVFLFQFLLVLGLFLDLFLPFFVVTHLYVYLFFLLLLVIWCPVVMCFLVVFSCCVFLLFGLFFAFVVV